jgi:hypothetical protein
MPGLGIWPFGHGRTALVSGDDDVMTNRRLAISPSQSLFDCARQVNDEIKEKQGLV